MTWSAAQVKHLLDRELASLQREASLRDKHTEQLRECNLEAIRAADRVAEERTKAQSIRHDALDRHVAIGFERLNRLIYVGVGIAVAISAAATLVPLFERLGR